MARFARCTFIAAGVLALAIAFTGCRGDAPPALSSSAQEASRVLPPDAQLITRVDLHDLQQNSGLTLSSERGITLRFLDSDVTFNPLSTENQRKLRTFIDATGFDPAADLQSVYAAAPSDSAETSGAGFAIIANMNPSQLQAYLADQDSLVTQHETYRDVALYRLTADLREGLTFALLSDQLIVAAPNSTALHGMIDRYYGEGPTWTDSPENRQRLFAESASEGPLGIVAYDLPTQRLLQQTDAESRIEKIGQAVRDVVGTLDVQDEKVRGRLLLTTDRNASDVASVVRGAVAALKTDADRSETQRALLDRIRVTDGDGTVTIRFDMETEQLVRMLFDVPQTRT